jgi:hypothetical protein
VGVEASRDQQLENLVYPMASPKAPTAREKEKILAKLSKAGLASVLDTLEKWRTDEEITAASLDAIQALSGDPVRRLGLNFGVFPSAALYLLREPSTFAHLLPFRPPILVMSSDFVCPRSRRCRQPVL